MRTLSYLIACLWISSTIFATDLEDIVSPETPEIQLEAATPQEEAEQFIEKQNIIGKDLSTIDTFSFSDYKKATDIDKVDDPTSLLDLYGSDLEQTNK